MKKNPLGCLADLFKKKTPPPPQYDYGAALARLASECEKSSAYSIILPSVFYDTSRGKYTVLFECAEKEFIREGEKKHFFSIRRKEKLFGENLEDLLEFAITYASYPDAFVVSPKNNLPKGVTVKINNFKRYPNQNSLNWKL